MQPSQATPSPPTRSFAGLLADFAAPEKKFPPSRDLDGLEDDVATLTYEHALRAHARYRPPADPPPKIPTQLPNSCALEDRAEAGPLSIGDSSPQRCPSPSPLPAQSSAGRKQASVTVRLTHEEDLQLRQRAAEAGLTVSAYLRSCAFEVDALRSQVKQTLAELRDENSSAKPATGWRRILPWGHKSN
jgi:hypothetical protein